MSVNEANLAFIGILEGSSVLLERTASFSNASVSFSNANEGEHTVTVLVCDKAENCISASFVMYLDKTAPTIDSFSISSGTTGTDGNRYVTGNSFSVTLKYSDDMGIGSVSLNSICTLSGTTYGLTSDYPNFNPTVSCDISSYSVSYTLQRYITITIYDISGNAVSATLYYYKIDETRKVSIVTFNLKAYGSLVNNWMGPQTLTSGKIAPIYSLSNTSYIDNNYMLLRDNKVMSAISFWLWTDFIQPGTNIVSTITSGTYISLESGYGGNMKTDNWYKLIEDKDTHSFTFTVRNIYGQTTSKSVTITFDFSSPTTPSLANTSGGNWVNTDVVLTASGSTDVGSGVYTYKYGAGTTTTSTSATSVTLSSEQNRYYYFRPNRALCQDTKVKKLTLLLKIFAKKAVKTTQTPNRAKG